MPKLGRILIRRGDIYWAGLNPTRGSEQSGRRPVVIIQNDVGNEFSSTTIVAPLTTKKLSKPYPTNVHLPKGIGGLKEESTVLLSQIRVVDKVRLEKKMGHLPLNFMEEMDTAIKASLGLV